MRNIFKTILNVKSLDNGLFQGNASGTFNSRQIYGGTMLAQIIAAGYQIVSKTFLLHNVHTYFLNPGKPNVPVNYKIIEAFKTKNFHKIFISGQQNDLDLVRFSLSFKVPEVSTTYKHVPNLKHKISYNKLLDFSAISKYPNKAPSIIAQKAKNYKKWLMDFPFIIKPIDPSLTKKDDSPNMCYWFTLKPEIEIPEKTVCNKQILMSFFSDFGILYPIIMNNPKSKFAFFTSLDQSLWFHVNEFDFDQKFFIENKCIYSDNNLTLNIGNIWSDKNELLVTLTQQGLLREFKSNSPNPIFAL